MGQSQIFTKTSYGAESSTYGTETASYAALPRVQEISIESDNSFIYDRGLGEGLNASNTYYGAYNASGAVSFDVVDFDFLKNWIGSKTGSGTSGSPYLLTEATEISAAASALGRIVPFSIEKYNADTDTLAQFATGCVGTSFSLSGSIGSKLSCSAEFLAQKSGFRESGASYTPNTDPAFIMINGTWRWGASAATLAGVQSFSIEYDGGIVGSGDETRDITSRFKNIPKMGQRTYTGSVQIILAQALADTIIKNHYGKESPSNTFTPEDGSTSVTATPDLEFSIDFVNNNRYATLQLDQCSIDNISIPNTLSNGLVIMTFNYTAREAKDSVPIKWWTV